MLTLPQAMQRGFAAYQRGELVEAERLCQAVLNAKSDYFDALHLLGVITARAGRPNEAVALLSRAVLSNPKDAVAHSHLGNVLRVLKRPAEALQSYERALALKPDHAEAYNNRGNALRDLKRHEEALRSYGRALALKPNLAEAYYNRGVALTDLKRHAEALADYERAIELRPDYPDAHNNRGNALGDLKRHADALQSYERALTLKPDYAEGYSNRGNALRDLKRPAEALRSYERAIALKPDYAEAYNNRGNALGDLKRPEEALRSYERAIALKPDYASAHWNLALCRLLLGDFVLGWQGYEWRLKQDEHTDQGRDFVQPLWLGAQPLKDKAILLHSEQGLGDTLQFCRYAIEVAALGANVLLEVQPSLVHLLAELEGVTQVLQKDSPLPAFDYHCPLMSLPLAFKTDLHSIPSRIPYIRSDAARVAAWRKKLGMGTKPRVALVWRGSPTHENDRNRSITLTEILPLISDWAEWVSLQKDVGESDAALLGSHADVRDIGGALENFADTAALLELMDVVVTVDTSVAHLAGAMGKAVWILLPFNPDWRWLLAREDSVWYPTARLFRQPAIGDWTTPIRRVREELEMRFHVRCD